MTKMFTVLTAAVGLAELLALQLVLAQPTPKPRFQPVSFEVELDAVRHNAHVESIRNDKNMPLYELRLDPVFDGAGGIIGWDVGVFDLRPEAKPHRRNLLAPSGNWHGLQSFMIIATSRDIFGQRWNAQGDGISCAIEVVDQKTSPSDALPGALLFESAKIRLQARPRND